MSETTQTTSTETAGGGTTETTEPIAMGDVASSTAATEIATFDAQDRVTNLSTMPAEIVVHLASFLNLRDKVQVSRTDPSLHNSMLLDGEVGSIDLAVGGLRQTKSSDRSHPGRFLDIKNADDDQLRRSVIRSRGTTVKEPDIFINYCNALSISHTALARVCPADSELLRKLTVLSAQAQRQLKYTSRQLTDDKQRGRCESVRAKLMAITKTKS